MGSPGVLPIGSPPSTNTGIEPGMTLNVSFPSSPNTASDSLFSHVTAPSIERLLPSSTCTVLAGTAPYSGMTTGAPLALMFKVWLRALPTTTSVSWPPARSTVTGLPPVLL